MHYEQFTYPRYDAPLMEAYAGRFESCFVVLHPFVRVPAEMAWAAEKQYPADEQILTVGAKCTWGEVAAGTGLKACARVNQALLTSIGAIVNELSDPAACNAMRKYLEANPVWMPVEGRFEPLLHADFLDAFDAAGQDEAVFVPEFGDANGIRRIKIAHLKCGAKIFPERGTFMAPDSSFLFTVDWDSFFTLFYGPRRFVDEIVRKHNLEGFFANLTTDHFWFNYSMGCATVTISPEHWPVM